MNWSRLAGIPSTCEKRDAAVFIGMRAPTMHLFSHKPERESSHMTSHALALII